MKGRPIYGIVVVGLRLRNLNSGLVDLYLTEYETRFLVIVILGSQPEQFNFCIFSCSSIWIISASSFLMYFL